MTKGWQVVIIRMQLSRSSHENHHWRLDQQVSHLPSYLEIPGNTWCYMVIPGNTWTCLVILAGLMVPSYLVMPGHQFPDLPGPSLFLVLLLMTILMKMWNWYEVYHASVKVGKWCKLYLIFVRQNPGSSLVLLRLAISISVNSVTCPLVTHD